MKKILICLILITTTSYAQEISPFKLQFSQKDQVWKIEGVRVMSKLQNALSGAFKGYSYTCSGTAILDIFEIPAAYTEKRDERLQRLQMESNFCNDLYGVSKAACRAKVSGMEFEEVVQHNKYIESLPLSSTISDLGECTQN